MQWQAQTKSKEIKHKNRYIRATTSLYRIDYDVVHVIYLRFFWPTSKSFHLSHHQNALHFHPFFVASVLSLVLARSKATRMLYKRAFFSIPWTTLQPVFSLRLNGTSIERTSARRECESSRLGNALEVMSSPPFLRER